MVGMITSPGLSPAYREFLCESGKSTARGGWVRGGTQPPPPPPTRLGKLARAWPQVKVSLRTWLDFGALAERAALVVCVCVCVGGMPVLGSPPPPP